MHDGHSRLIVGGCRRRRIPAKDHVSTYLCCTSPRPPRTAYSGDERLWHINPKYWLYSVSLLISEGGLDQETGRRTSLASKQFPQIRTTDRAGVPSLGGWEVIPGPSNRSARRPAGTNIVNLHTIYTLRADGQHVL